MANPLPEPARSTPTIGHPLPGYDAATLLRTASAGRLLRGMFWDGESWRLCLNRLVEISDDQTLLGPELTEHSYSTMSTKERQHYICESKCCHGDLSLTAKCGLGNTTLWTAGDFNASSSVSGTSTGSIKGHLTSSCHTRKKIMAQADFSCNLDVSKLLLSVPAVDALQKISADIRLRKKTDLSINTFFKTFGSHATYGIVHFGAASMTETVDHSDSNRDAANQRKLKSARVDGGFTKNGVANAALDLSAKRNADVSSDFSSAYNTSDGENEHFVIGGIRNGEGGGADAGCRKSIAIIAYEYKKVSVWALVKNCKREFQDAAGLALTLKSAWETLTGLRDEPQIESDSLDVIQSAESLLTKFPSKVKADSSFNVQQWEECLEDLCNQLKEIETGADHPELRGRGWACIPSLGKVLQELLEHRDELQSPDGVLVKTHLRHLMLLAGGSDFPMKPEIDRLLNGVKDAALHSVIRSNVTEISYHLMRVIRKRVLPDVQSSSLTMQDRESTILQVVNQELNAVVVQLLKRLRVELNHDLTSVADTEKLMKDICLSAVSLAMQMENTNECISDDTLKSLFDCLWEMMSKISLTQDGQRNFSQIAKMTLYDEFRGQSLHVTNAILDHGSNAVASETDRLLNGAQILSSHFNHRWANTCSAADQRLYSDCLATVLGFGNGVLKKGDCLVASQGPEQLLMNASVFKPLIAEVVNEVKDFNESRGAQITLTQEFVVFLSVEVCMRTALVLNEEQRKFESQSDMTALLLRLKEPAFSYFQSRFEQEKDDVRSATLISNAIKTAVIQSAERDTKATIYSSFSRRFHVPMKQLLRTVMTSLIDENAKFDDFMDFINDSKDYVRKWLDQNFHRDFFTSSTDDAAQYAKLFRENIHRYLDSMNESVLQASVRSVKQARADDKPLSRNLLQVWIKHLCESNTVGIKADDVNVTSGLRICDLDHFTQVLILEMGSLKGRIMQEQKMEWSISSDYPPDLVLESVWGRSQDCPFCGEPSSEDPPTCRSVRPTGIRGIKNPPKLRLRTSTCYSLYFAVRRQVRSQGSFTCADTGFKCHPGPITVRHAFKVYRSKKSDVDPYWQWFACKFKADLEKHHNSKFLEFPESWRKVSATQAIESLECLEEERNKNPSSLLFRCAFG